MKKLISIILAISICFLSSISAFAKVKENPYEIEAQYVYELVSISEEELNNISLERAKNLFEKAFLVSANDYSEEEIRLALDGLSFGLKFEDKMREVKQSGKVEIEPSYPYTTFSTTSGKAYSGSVGVAWTRDTTKGHSPLTLGEILSGTYTLEVDYLTWDSSASILAASANFDSYNELKEAVASNLGGTILGFIVCRILEIKGPQAVIASFVVSTALNYGWNWLKKIDRSRMLDSFNNMSKRQYMKVEFMWSSNMVNRFYTNISKTNTIPNPFPGTYGDWHIDTYGYLYGY